MNLVQRPGVDRFVSDYGLNFLVTLPVVQGLPARSRAVASPSGIPTGEKALALPDA
jgi:hypothetical protein